MGDWTEQLFRLGLEDPRMPLWITAAQPSVLEQTLYYDNGECEHVRVGVTSDYRSFEILGPAMSVISPLRRLLLCGVRVAYWI